MPSANPKRGAKPDLASRVAVLTFFALLWLPLAISLLAPSRDVSASEQRSLAAAPALSFAPSALAGLPAALDAYLDDRIGLRDDLIRAWAWLHIEGLGVSPSESLIVGRDGWFFFGDETAVAQARGVARLSEGELAAWTRALVERRDWLRARGVAYLLVLVPNKHGMYGEYLPPSLPRTGAGSPLDQLADHLARASDVPVLDVRADLEALGRTTRTYHKTDTHWNDRGAYAAYSAILRRASELLPAWAPLRPVSVTARERTIPGMGLPRIVGLSRMYPEESLDLVVDRPRAAVPPQRRAAFERRAERRLPFALGTGDPGQPTAVMFRDSFANALVPYLSESFRRIVYVWTRDVDPTAVDAEAPDIVLHEIAERFLDAPLPPFAPVLRAAGTR